MPALKAALELRVAIKRNSAVNEGPFPGVIVDGGCVRGLALHYCRLLLSDVNLISRLNLLAPII
jgi:hypothetical protein